MSNMAVAVERILPRPVAHSGLERVVWSSVCLHRRLSRSVEPWLIQITRTVSPVDMAVFEVTSARVALPGLARTSESLCTISSVASPLPFRAAQRTRSCPFPWDIATITAGNASGDPWPPLWRCSPPVCVIVIVPSDSLYVNEKPATGVEWASVLSSQGANQWDGTARLIATMLTARPMITPTTRWRDFNGRTHSPPHIVFVYFSEAEYVYHREPRPPVAMGWSPVGDHGQRSTFSICLLFLLRGGLWRSAWQ